MRLSQMNLIATMKSTTRELDELTKDKCLRALLSRCQRRLVGQTSDCEIKKVYMICAVDYRRVDEKTLPNQEFRNGYGHSEKGRYPGIVSYTRYLL